MTEEHDPLTGVGDQLGLPSLSDQEILQAYPAIMRVLREHGAIRSNPVADYTEALVCRKLDLTLSSKSTKGYDAVRGDSTRYWIKSRRLTPGSSVTQFSAIVQLESATPGSVGA